MDRMGQDEIPLRCACGISVPPAGVRATFGENAAVGPLDLLPVSVVRRRPSELARRRTTKQPAACAAGCIVPKGCGEDENRKSSPAPSRRLWKAFIINDIF